MTNTVTLICRRAGDGLQIRGVKLNGVEVDVVANTDITFSAGPDLAVVMLTLVVGEILIEDT